MTAYLGAIDQGTTSTRFIVFDRSGRIVSVAQKEHEQIYPKPGWVEHDPEEIWRRTQDVICEAMQKGGFQPSDLAGIGITNQRETTIVWNRKTGSAVYNAIVWQDTRVEDYVAEFSRDGGQDRFRAKTGLPLAAYFSGLKIRWILNNVKGAREAAESGDLLFGNIDSFLVWKLTGGTKGGIHLTDVTNASRTQLIDLHTLNWDDEQLKLFGIPKRVLPRIASSSEVYGKVATIPSVQGVPVAGILGDQQAALFGQTCFNAGEAKNTYGTGCFLLMNTGSTPVQSKYGLISTLAYSVKDNGVVYFVPSFSGLYAPYWKTSARGVIAGLTRYANKGHLARAVLESTAFQTREVVEAMQLDSKINLDVLRTDGGMVENVLLMQFQSDILNRPVVRPVVKETTALGASYAGGLAVGFYKDFEELRANWAIEHTWNPHMEDDVREEKYRLWKKAVTRSFDWVDDKTQPSSKSAQGA